MTNMFQLSFTVLITVQILFWKVFMHVIHKF